VVFKFLSKDAIDMKHIIARKVSMKKKVEGIVDALRRIFPSIGSSMLWVLGFRLTTIYTFCDVESNSPKKETGRSETKLLVIDVNVKWLACEI